MTGLYGSVGRENAFRFRSLERIFEGHARIHFLPQQFEREEGGVALVQMEN